MARLHLFLGALSLALATAAANAAVVNVHYTAATGNELMNGTASNTSTVAPLAYTGTMWNDINGSYSPTVSSPLTASDGSATTITAAISGNSLGFQETPYWAGMTLLHQGYWSTPLTLTIGGLATDGTQYNVYLAGDANGNGGSYTIGATTLSSSGAQSTSWASGVNYVHFDNVTPDGGGNIVVTMSNYPLSGFQIMDVASAVPEPASLAIFGLGGLALMVRRRRSI